MAAYWREPSTAAGKSPVGGTVITRYAATPVAATPVADSNTISQNCSSSREASFDEAAVTNSRSCGNEHPLVGGASKATRNSHNNSRLFTSVATAKAAVRSASNRAAELSHLLREGNNPPREECLTKAESAVRAAESAISCANERLFQLDLMAAADQPIAQELGGDIDGAQGTPTGNERRPSNQYPSESTTSSAYSSSPLSAHIEELTQQLRLAQGLQAVAVTARARLSRRFALEATAAVQLQALVRGSVTRWRERWKKETLAKKENTVTAHFEPAFAPSLSLGKDVKERAGTVGLKQEGTDVGILPRTEELWWTPAEAESADAIGEPESALLRAIVKLQATVRSRLARSQTIAAVNARFVEHFDEEHQHPFYFCSETDSSQWNLPFGFASGGRGGGFSSSPVRGVRKTELLAGKNYSSRAYSSSSAESAEDVEEMEPIFRKAVVKLQAIVRSWVSRSKTFAAVNARFVRRFDEGYQQPFYVCNETNASQWNQPLGFGCKKRRAKRGDDTFFISEEVEADTTSTASKTANMGHNFEEGKGVAKNDCGGTTNEGAGEKTLCDTLSEREAAVTVIQCAVRAARARAQLAEKIVLASL